MSLKRDGCLQSSAGGGLFPLLLILASCLPSSSLAKTWHVHSDGSGNTETIQEAIDLAANNDTVLVHPGTYQCNLNLIGKDLVLKSVSGPEVTTLDGSHQGSVIVIRGGVSSEAQVCGFKVINGSGFAWLGTASLQGGGIYVGRSWPRICHNRIENNSARTGGGMVVRTEEERTPLPDIVIEHNVFVSNLATGNGGGLRLFGVHAQVLDNSFVSNRAAFDGGGVDDRNNLSVSYIGNYFAYNHATDKGGGANITNGSAAEGTLVFADNVLFSNTSLGLHIFDSGSGGGVRIGYRSGIVENNTLVFNDGLSLSGASGGGISLGWGPERLIVRNNILAYNRGAGIACYDLSHPESIVLGPNLFWQNDQGPIGNLLDSCPAHWEDPSFIEDPQFCDWKSGDFTVASTSPAISNGAVFGAFPSPACGAVVQARQTTWGRLKAKFSGGD